MTTRKRLRIAYLSSADPRDLRSWSGTHYSVLTSLEKYCGDVVALGPFIPKREYLIGRVISFVTSRLFKKRFDYTHSRKIAKAYGKYFNTKLAEGNFDIVFAVAASSELTYLETSLPIFYLADATFSNVAGYYPFYSNLLETSMKEATLIQQLALDKCTHLFFPSDWAANSAMREYGIDKERITVTPLGANMSVVPEYVRRSRSKNDSRVRLLFIGVEWERKGGPCAVQAMQELQARGYDASLTIVGCTPEINGKGIQIIPFINKNDPAQRQHFLDLFRQNDFLLLPTQAECFGLVFCEASAMGLPSLASDTGGVSGAVRDGINGYLLPSNANGKAYANKIIEIISEDGKYDSLSASSRELFDRELNWDAWGQRVSEKIRKSLNID